MSRLDKYRGVFPAFYACYDDRGDISPERTQALVEPNTHDDAVLRTTHMRMMMMMDSRQHT